MSKAHWIGGALLIGLMGTGAWWWRASLQPTRVAGPAPVAAAAVADAASRPAVAASAPAIQFPIDTSTQVSAAATPPDLGAALADLFGRKAVQSLFQLDDFAHRFVATVDNLGRSHAPMRLSPLHPAPGRFTVAAQGDGVAVSADNGLRYTPYVLLIETVDMGKLVATYRQFYPLFQRAFEELGYPGRYFNDRLVAVIDQTLAAPQLTGPLKVRLPAINGPVQPPRPWVLYEFADPALQDLAAGQKILLRMGSVNEARVRIKLVELRRLVAAGAAPRESASVR